MKRELISQAKNLQEAWALLREAPLDHGLVFAPSDGEFADTYYVVPRDKMDAFLAQWGYPSELPTQRTRRAE